MDVALHEEAQRLLKAKLQKQGLEGTLQELPELGAADKAHLNRMPLQQARSLQGVPAVQHPGCQGGLPCLLHACHHMRHQAPSACWPRLPYKT